MKYYRIFYPYYISINLNRISVCRNLVPLLNRSAILTLLGITTPVEVSALIHQPIYGLRFFVNRWIISKKKSFFVSRTCTCICIVGLFWRYYVFFFSAIFLIFRALSGLKLANILSRIVLFKNWYFFVVLVCLHIGMRTLN